MELDAKTATATGATLIAAAYCSLRACGSAQQSRRDPVPVAGGHRLAPGSKGEPQDLGQLDYKQQSPGYWDCAWPVECGGPRRQKLVATRGLALCTGETLASTTRDSAGWPVMFIQREPGQLYLQCGAALRPRELPPARRRPGDCDCGWLEQVDPVTLQTLKRSADLPSGGHLWCGAVVAHENGNLYMVNGCFCHRLTDDCEVIAERRLPFDGPYNGLLVLSDGNLIMKNLGDDSEPCLFSVLDPNTLHPVGEPLQIDEAAMGRISADKLEDGREFVYFTTESTLRRLQYSQGVLRLDEGWGGSYNIEGEDQSAGWDTTIAAGAIWMQDMGRPPGWQLPTWRLLAAAGLDAIGLTSLGRSSARMATAAQRAYRFDIADPSRRDVISSIGRPNAFNPGPPLYDPERQILVHYDTVNRKVHAHRYLRSNDGSGGRFELLWVCRYRNTVQMMLYVDTGELVLEDAPHAISLSSNPLYKDAFAVVVDIETGEERGRAPLDEKGTSGMFVCPGWSRDFYVGSIFGQVARVYVDEPVPKM